MPVCIYCEKDKPFEEMSLEHVIPRSLGGAYAPNRLKTRRVCKKCNSNLGLFVDASFEKSPLVTHHLQLIALACYSPISTNGVPLVYMGKTEFRLPQMKANEICELYLGPRGETVYWIRPHSEHFYWYAGGNPRNVKTVSTRAYFFLSENTASDIRITFLSFRDAFKGRKVRKVFGTTFELEGTSIEELGFSEPDQLDQKRIAQLHLAQSNGNKPRIEMCMNMDFDVRFLAKLARGIGFCMFGDQALSGNLAKELYKSIWHQKDDPTPRIPGAHIMGSLGADKKFVRLCGHPHGIVLTLLQAPEGIVLNINIAGKLIATTLCMDKSMLTDENRQLIGDGIAFVLFRHLQTALEIPLSLFIAHRSGLILYPPLQKIEEKINQNPYCLKAEVS